MLFDDPLRIALPPEECKVEVELWKDGTELRVARVRVYGDGTLETGSHLADVGIDFAQLALLDAAEPDDFRVYDCPEGSERWIDALNRVGLFAAIPYGSGLDRQMFVVSTGFGDGRYPVYKLLRGSCMVGIEIVFIEFDMPSD
jgi:hypothetical protein